MTWIRLRLTRLATVCAVVCVVGSTFAPPLAFACEGAGEEKEVITEEVKFESSNEELEKGENKTGSFKITVPVGVTYNQAAFEKGNEKWQLTAGGDTCSKKLLTGACHIDYEWLAAGAVAGKTYTDTLISISKEDNGSKEREYRLVTSNKA
jgi:hypothetical protein